MVGPKIIGVTEKDNLDPRKQQNEMGIVESGERDDDHTLVLVSRAPLECYRGEKVPYAFCRETPLLTHVFPTWLNSIFSLVLIK